LDRYLVEHRHGATWLVAVDSSMTAAPIELATGQAVMSMGGFNGTDPWPTLSAFKALVAEGKVRYVLVGGVGAAGGAPLGGGFPALSGAGNGTGPPVGPGAGGPSGPGGPGPGGFAPPSVAGGSGGPGAAGSVSAVDTWVKTHGTVVPAGDVGSASVGTLYEVTPASFG